jgi:hypothetical protein
MTRRNPRGRKAIIGDDDLLLLALWRKYLALQPVTRPSDSALATALLQSAVGCHAVSTLLGASKHGTLRNRLHRLRLEINAPLWGLLTITDAWARENGLPSRLPSARGAAIPDLRRLALTEPQIRTAASMLILDHLIRHRRS